MNRPYPCTNCPVASVPVNPCNGDQPGCRDYAWWLQEDHARLRAALDAERSARKEVEAERDLAIKEMAKCRKEVDEAFLDQALLSELLDERTDLLPKVWERASKAEAERDRLREALEQICQPITVTGSPDVLSACDDLHSLIVEVARAALQAKAGGES